MEKRAAARGVGSASGCSCRLCDRLQGLGEHRRPEDTRHRRLKPATPHRLLTILLKLTGFSGETDVTPGAITTCALHLLGE